MQFGAVAAFSAMTLLVSAASGAPRPDAVLSVTGIEAGAGSGELRARLRLWEDTLDPSTETDGTEAADEAIGVVLKQQAVRGAENLARVSAVTVPNVTQRAELVVDARAERAVAELAAVTAASARDEAVLSARATVEAQAASDARAAAIAAAQQADAAAAAQATQLSATREAEAAAAAATVRADALEAAADASKQRFSKLVAGLVIALISLTGGIFGARRWRNRKEPFVLKSIPVGLAANAHA